MATIQLDSSVASLRLTTSDAPWCEVSLVTGSQIIFLGGDSPGKVRDGLLRFVGEEFRQASAGEMEGTPVTWVMSLMEEHTSLYAADAVGERTLFIQTADGDALAKLVLDKAQCGVWRKTLTELPMG